MTWYLFTLIFVSLLVKWCIKLLNENVYITFNNISVV